MGMLGTADVCGGWRAELAVAGCGGGKMKNQKGGMQDNKCPETEAGSKRLSASLWLKPVCCSGGAKQSTARPSTKKTALILRRTAYCGMAQSLSLNQI
jgi:hypothetical protein